MTALLLGLGFWAVVQIPLGIIAGNFIRAGGSPSRAGDGDGTPTRTVPDQFHSPFHGDDNA